MTSLDQVFVPLATDLLGKFGATAKFRRVTKTFDAATRSNTISNSDTTIKMKPPEPYSVNRINGTSVQEGDLTTMIAGEALSVVPTVRDKIVYLATVWQIVSVGPVVSGDQTAAYNLQLRQ